MTMIARTGRIISASSLHPVATFRPAAKQVRDALQEMRATGSQQILVQSEKLMSRAEIDAHLKST